QVDEWRLKYAIEKTPKGNSMTQEFYAQEILPKYLEHIKWLQQKKRHKIYFQEDGDPSHGHRSSDNVVQRAKRTAHLYILTHPPQSPDLRPIEGIWLIMKQRLRGQTWKTVAEFKEAIQREWTQISQSEIRKRVAEMPLRCKKMIQLKGRRYRSKLWR